MEIYADIFFIINFVMDLLIFWAASKFLRYKTNFYRIILGALVVTILYCLSIFYFNYSIWFSFIFLIIGVIIAFRPDNFLALIKLILLVHIIAFILGGMTIAYMFRIENFSLKILVISTSIFFVTIKLFVNYIKKRILSRQVICRLNIFLGNNHSSFNALIDTGNSLYDKITGLPIIVAEFDKVKNIFPLQIQSALREKDFEKLCLAKIKFNFVPFKSVGNTSGILICFRPDFIKIFSETKTNILVGICNFRLSDSYHGLINPDLLN